ncbi:MAG: UDP-N-acetylmuramoyl-L-alanyl-D-glutamate--2,6-diaminopimelate ligase [Burkholderiales bacterium]|nr:UDP-N-acetylmuramoyl-L-alanyl-D-glutamate--2,6-diaminopimelate ligase [Burkholderiales bacterium]
MDAAKVLAVLSAAGARLRGACADSRHVSPGDLFLAYPGHGARDDGRAYIPAALERGAAAVVWEKAGFDWKNEWRVPNLGLDGVRALAGPLAARIHGEPSHDLAMIGVTGTNGKTSVVQWVAQALAACNVPCGSIGTLGARFGAIDEVVANTTPDATVLQRTLARMRGAGAGACAMEVSSIGLDQERVAGVAFDCAVFTNLSRDHLDYHADMGAYESAKARLFEMPGLTHAVVNIDDAAGVRLMARMPAGVARIACTIGGAEPIHALVEDEGRLIARDIVFEADGARFLLDGSFGRVQVRSPVWGEFNIANLLCVAGVLLSRGIALPDVAAALEQLTAVPGRMNTLGGASEPLVVIDYAHTPDALVKVLEALRPLARARGGRLTAVFGCGGDRDPGKRPAMGAAAARLADQVILTSDNPRGEAPEDIVAQIAAGAAARVPAIELDRARAIGTALMAAAGEDVILIAGKGHETTQEVRGIKSPFSDHDVARSALEDRRHGGAT